jgi:predicted extracellular nuclease
MGGNSISAKARESKLLTLIKKMSYFFEQGCFSRLAEVGKNRGRPFTLILNHWPSRAFGSALTEKKRMRAARVARAVADSLLLQNPDADIIVMGDFNDSPQDRSVKRSLRSTLNRLQAQRAKDGTLYNCWGGSSQPGSYSYRGRWRTR